MDEILKKALREAIMWVAWAHDEILKINDGFEYSLNDKELHFLVMGVGGVCVFLLAYLLFRRMARGNVGCIAWLYAFTLVTAVAFAVEVGQGLTGTGDMDINDAAFGILGFLAFSAVIALARFFIRRR